jgi:hypothetical protein
MNEDGSHPSAIEPVFCQSADEFLEKTSPWGPFFRHESVQFLSLPWVFRGHSNSYWSLQPKAFRIDTEMLTAELSRWEPIREHKSQPTSFDQALAEMHTLRAFYLLADQEGLSIPEDSQMLRAHMLDPWNYLIALQKEDAAWPPSELLSLAGLAQHQGLPTRLLDWSYNASVATYFACVDAAEEWAGLQSRRLTEKQRLRRDNGRLEVWALNLYMTTPYDGVGLDEAPFVSVTTPGAGNENLRAQHGLFTLDNPRHFSWNTVAEVEPMDQKILRRQDRFTQPVLRRFQLEIRHAAHLLTLLARERITGAKFFPGYPGVMKALYERKWRILAGRA